jgi:hypothetical protein
VKKEASKRGFAPLFILFPLSLKGGGFTLKGIKGGEVNKQ